MSLKDWDRRVDSNNEEAPLSRRRFLASTTAGVASALVTTQATADTLADVPPREVGAVLSGLEVCSPRYASGGGTGDAQRRSKQCDQFENATRQAGRDYHAHRSALRTEPFRQSRSRSGEAPLAGPRHDAQATRVHRRDRKSTRLNSSHLVISYAVFCLQKQTS